MHYQRLLRNGDPKKGARNPVVGTCSIEGCDSPAYSRGMCHGHYKRMIEGRPIAGTIRQRNNIVDGKKKCPSCAIVKPISEFPKAKDRISSWCRECMKHSRRKMYYGLTRDEYALLSASGCAVCGTTEKLVVDHDHDSGEVRGVLCTQCNVAIGMANDDPDRLIKLSEYLRGA